MLSALKALIMELLLFSIDGHIDINFCQWTINCVCSICIFNSIVNLHLWAAPANSKHCTFGFRHTNHRCYNEWPEKIVYLSEISSGNGLQGGFLTLRQLRNQFADCYYNYTIATRILFHEVISNFDDCQSTNLNIITICRKGFPLRLI